MRNEKRKIKPAKAEKRKPEPNMSCEESQPTKVLKTDHELREKITWLKHACPSKNDREMIFLYMRETLDIRRDMVKSCDESFSVLKEFPRFVDMPELVS